MKNKRIRILGILGSCMMNQPIRVSEITTTLKMERMKMLSFMTREALIVSMKRKTIRY